MEFLKNTVIITDKKKIEVDNVTSILSFDEQTLVLELGENGILIEGDEMKVENLSKETKKILVSGIIEGVRYIVPKVKKNKKGAF